jgi:flagellar motor switch protein FliN
MTEATAPARQPELAEFLQIWADSFSQMLGQVPGSSVPCIVRKEAPADFQTGDPTPAGGDDLWAVVTLSGGLRGEMRLRVVPATVVRLAQMFMSATPTPEAESAADHRQAVVELLRQVSGIVRNGAKARWDEVQSRVELAPAASSWPSAATYWLQIGEEGPASMALEIVLSAALVAGLGTEKAEATAAVLDSSTTVPSSLVSPPALADSGPSAGTLDLLMDVQLAMTMRFGAKRLLLREVLDLSPGAVVELDRKVQEPVELLLDGKLVARGEVVVIDGNYGLRVTDVSPLDPGRAP